MENVVTRIVDKPVFLEAVDRTNSHRVYHVLRVATCHFHVLRWQGRGLVGVPPSWSVFLSLPPPLQLESLGLDGKQGMPSQYSSSQSRASEWENLLYNLRNIIDISCLKFIISYKFHNSIIMLWYVKCNY